MEGYERVTSPLLAHPYFADAMGDAKTNGFADRWYKAQGLTYVPTQFDPGLDLEFTVIERHGRNFEPCSEGGHCEICADPKDSDGDGYADCADIDPNNPNVGRAQ